MPDDEGYLVPGDLPLGSYAAMEGDLGESLMGPLGFSAPAVEWVSDETPVTYVASGFSTGPRATVSFLIRGGS